jgi:hypothetical protein
MVNSFAEYRMFILGLVFEGQFFHGEHLRWNLGWATPNYAGAFLVTLLCFFWAVSGNWRWRTAAFAVEAAGYFLLARTYSRGAMVAWGLAWLFGLAVSRAWRNPAQRLLWAARAGALTVMLLAAGFGWSRMVKKGTETTLHGVAASDGSTLGQMGRIKQSSEATTMEDGSIMNRLALWRGGLEMITAAPWRGWGAGESGRAYMNWFQGVDRTEGYTTMVNSYLHVSVEHGLPVLAVVIFGLVALLMTAEKTAVIDRRYRGLALAAGASLVAWAVANMFTTLWIEPKLWIIPGIACAMIGVGGWRNRGAIRWRWAIRMSAASALLFACGLLAAGMILRTERVWRAEPGSGRTVVVHSRGLSRDKLAPTTTVEAWQVWPDTGVLGPTPGKELRRWIETLPTTTSVVVHPEAPEARLDGDQIVERFVLFGRQAERLGRDLLPEHPQIVLIHPRGAPPAKWTEGKKLPQITVFIPAIDETGEAARWQRWAVERGARVVVSPGVGQDIRAVLPGVIGFLGTEGKEAR